MTELPKARTKHIGVRHHFLRDHVEKGNVILTHVRTEDQVADIFTKGLSREPFQRLRVIDAGASSVDTIPVVEGTITRSRAKEIQRWAPATARLTD